MEKTSTSLILGRVGHEEQPNAVLQQMEEQIARRDIIMNLKSRARIPCVRMASSGKESRNAVA